MHCELEETLRRRSAVGLVRLVRLAGLVGLVGLVSGAAWAQTPTATVDAAALQIPGGFRDREVLVDRFLAALSANDKDALLALLVPADFYRDVIIPGTVAPDQPARQWSEKSRQFFTDNFFHKSSLYADVLLKDWGGRELMRKKISFTRPTQTYKWYTADGELRVEVDAVPPTDGEPVVRTGFIAEINGTYKFIGFLHDDD